MSDLAWNCSTFNAPKLQPSLHRFPKHKIKTILTTEVPCLIKPKTSLKKNRENRSYHLLTQYASTMQKANRQQFCSKSFRAQNSGRDFSNQSGEVLRPHNNEAKKKMINPLNIKKTSSEVYMNLRSKAARHEEPRKQEKGESNNGADQQSPHPTYSKKINFASNPLISSPGLQKAHAKK